MAYHPPSDHALGNSPGFPSAADLAQALDRACVGSCTCLTKTPEITVHAESCSYRIMAHLAALLREDQSEFGPISWCDDTDGLPVCYLRLDLAFGHSGQALRASLEELTSLIRSLLPRARFHEADPRPLLEALSKAEAILSCKPSLVPMENQDDD